jgi:hypothetical protein
MHRFPRTVLARVTNPADGGAFDIDYGNTGNSVIDNYGHDTQGYCVALIAHPGPYGIGCPDGLRILHPRIPRHAAFDGTVSHPEQHDPVTVHIKHSGVTDHHVRTPGLGRRKAKVASAHHNA